MVDETGLHTLYRFFDRADELLYVGITCNPPLRFSAHRSEKDWWGSVARISMEQLPSRDALKEAERVAIRTERPRFNIIHNRSSFAQAEVAEPKDLPRGIRVGDVYAFGLTDGSCPVGIVAEGDDDGFVLELFSFGDGEFGHASRWITFSSLLSWKRAEEINWRTPHGKRWVQDHCLLTEWPPPADARFFDTLALGAFQDRFQDESGFAAPKEEKPISRLKAQAPGGLMSGAAILDMSLDGEPLAPIPGHVEMEVRRILRTAANRIAQASTDDP